MACNGAPTVRTRRFSSRALYAAGVTMGFMLTASLGFLAVDGAMELAAEGRLPRRGWEVLPLILLALAALLFVLYRAVKSHLDFPSRAGRVVAHMFDRNIVWQILARSRRKLALILINLIKLINSGREILVATIGPMVTITLYCISNHGRSAFALIRHHGSAVVFWVMHGRGQTGQPLDASIGASPIPFSRRGVWGRSELGTALHAWRSAIIGVGVFSGLINVLMLTGAIFMLEIYDRVLPSRSVPTLLGLAVLATILYTAMGVLDLIRARILARIGGALNDALAGRVFSTVLRLSLIDGNQSEGTQPVRDLENVRSFVSGAGPTAFFDLPWVPIYLFVIFLFHPLLGLTALLGALLLVALTLVSELCTRDAMNAAMQSGSLRASLAESSRRNAEVISALGMSGAMEVKWRQINGNYLAEQQKVSDVSGSLGAFSKVFRLMLQSAVLGIGAYLVIHQQASAGIIIAAAILAARALAPIDSAIAHWKSFVAARKSWGKLDELLADLPAKASPMSLPKPSASLSVQSLTSRAPGTQNLILLDVNLTVAAGQGLGVIGHSGSGKSTLMRTLVGAWQPLAGRVRLDGAELDQWSPEELGRYVGYLPQHIELFAGTVAENIARFERNPDPHAIIQAARAAGVHELIVSLREGYGAQIGEYGETFSSGQRQRLALARALYRDPFLVVLDEPNSNLDYEGEMALTQAIVRVRERGGIVVVAAHRSSALASVDHVLALDQGRVKAFGPKEKVLEQLFPKLQSVTVRHRPGIARSHGPRVMVDAGE